MSGEYVRARTGLSNRGLPLWRHECGYVEAFTDSDLTEMDGCDACASESDNPFEWQPLYLATSSTSTGDSQ